MIKRMADFFRKPAVYRTLTFLGVAIFVYFELIAPLMGTWTYRQPTMLHGLIMRGR
jgi:hypothetical protein